MLDALQAAVKPSLGPSRSSRWSRTTLAQTKARAERAQQYADTVRGIEDRLAVVRGHGEPDGAIVNSGGYVECVAASRQVLHCSLRGISDPDALIGLASAWEATILDHGNFSYVQVASGSYGG